MNLATAEQGEVRTKTSRGAWRELALVIAGFAALTVFMTSPLAFELGSVGRVDNADAKYIIWNIAWVARTLVVDPLHVFDANIFYPHRWTLVYSETNFGAGVLGIPVYWLTRNPYATSNFVLLLSFVLSATGTYYLVSYLTRDRRAAVVSAICFAFCPYVFSHTAHIHRLMTAGLPFGMLALHRLADRPTAARGAILGAVIGVQTWFCGYYGVFLSLIVAFAVVVIAIVGRRWADLSYWKAVASGAVVASAGVLPLFALFAKLQRSTGFARPFEGARLFAADWRAYFASSAYAHSWMLRFLGHWKEVLFPGFIALALGVTGVVVGLRQRGRIRELTILYTAIALVTLWASFGPDAGLYTALYSVLPVFSLMHAPSRFGLAVVLALSVLAGVALATVFSRVRRPSLVAGAAVAVVIAELLTPMYLPKVPPLDAGYRVLAALPRGPLLELPVFSRPHEAARTYYMLNSTAHWMPLVDAYSSYIPQDMYDRAGALGGFPSRESFKLLERDRVRYAVFHPQSYPPEALPELQQRLIEFAPYLGMVYRDNRLWVYEIIGYPQ